MLTCIASINPSSIYAAGPDLSIFPGIVNNGDHVSIDITNIPHGLYSVYVVQGSTTDTGEVRSIVGFGESSSGNCSTSGTTSPDGLWGLFFCINPTKVTGIIQTENFDKYSLSPNSDIDTFYSVIIKDQDNKVVSQQTFVIQASSSTPKTFIMSADKNGYNQTDSVGLTITNIKYPGVFHVYFDGQTIDDAIVKTCNSSCKFTLIIPPFTTGDTQIIAQDPQGNSQTLTIHVNANGFNPGDQPPPCGEVAADGTCAGVNTGLSASPVLVEPQSFITFIMGILLSISGGIALLIIIYAGYKMMTSRGNPEAVKGARDLITSAIIGLIFLIFSLIILEVIGVDILQVPGLSH